MLRRTLMCFFALIFVISGCPKQEISEPAPPPPPPSKPATKSPQRIFSAVPSQSTSVFESNPHQGLLVKSRGKERVAYDMATPFSETITLESGQRCFLAGDASGQAGWSIDDFLLIEIQGTAETKRFIIGTTASVYYKGNLVEQLGTTGSNFSPDDIDLTPHLPKGEPVKLTISALDFVGIGHVSDLYLIIR